MVPALSRVRERGVVRGQVLTSLIVPAAFPGFIMSDPSHCWYIRADGKVPVDAFSAEELLQSWRAGRLDGNTLCWCEGMPEWLPLRKVEPFASVIRAAGSPPGRAPSKLPPVAGGRASPPRQAKVEKLPPVRLAKWLLPLAVPFVVIAGVAVAYFHISESQPIQRARLQIINEDYDAARRTLDELPHQYFHRGEVAYLQTLVDLKKYASAKRPPDEPSLPVIKQRLKEVLDADPRRRTQANRDLANAVAQVPADADDAFRAAWRSPRPSTELQVLESGSPGGCACPKGGGAEPPQGCRARRDACGLRRTDSGLESFGGRERRRSGNSQGGAARTGPGGNPRGPARHR